MIARFICKAFEGICGEDLEWSAPTFRIDSKDPVEVGLDGEALIMDPPLLFEALPGALRVRIPRHALGRSPAARAVHLLARSTVAQLVAVVAGRLPEPEPVSPTSV